jgi:protein-tyrosine kinase
VSVTHNCSDALGFASGVTEGADKQSPEIDLHTVSDGSRCNPVYSETLEKVSLRRKVRDARSTTEQLSKLSKVIQLTEVLGTDAERPGTSEFSSRTNEEPTRRSADISDAGRVESMREGKDTASENHSRRFLWQWLWLTGRAVSSEDGPPLIINKREVAGATEQIQLLQTQIERWQAETERRVLLVAGAIQKEGKSFVALNLAAACASPQTPVLLIDADLRRPSLHRALGVTSSNGLGAYLNGVSDFTGCLHQTEVPGLTFIPAGNFSGSPIRLFADTGMGDLLNAARALRPSHLIIIDSSAALTAAEVQILATLVDATLLVTAANRTPRAAVMEAAELLKAAPITGVVLNRFETPFSTLRTIRRATN